MTSFNGGSPLESHVPTPNARPVQQQRHGGGGGSGGGSAPSNYGALLQPGRTNPRVERHTQLGDGAASRKALGLASRIDELLDGSN